MADEGNTQQLKQLSCYHEVDVKLFMVDEIVKQRLKSLLFTTNLPLETT